MGRAVAASVAFALLGACASTGGSHGSKPAESVLHGMVVATNMNDNTATILDPAAKRRFAGR